MGHTPRASKQGRDTGKSYKGSSPNQRSRDHALCFALGRSPSCQLVFCAPGNAGNSSSGDATYLPDLDVADSAVVICFCHDKGVGLVVVGPEAPLVSGLVNDLIATGVPAFGPSSEAAALEVSKDFIKNLCYKYQIPTAKYGTFTDGPSANEYSKEQGAPIRIKAYGLVAGKVVVVQMTLNEAYEAVDSMLVKGDFGSASGKVIVEEYLKRDTAPILTPELQSTVMSTIIVPTIRAMAEEGYKYVGVLYAGFMIEKKSELSKLIEYSVRFRDPECLVYDALSFDSLLISFSFLVVISSSAMVIVMASKGYPGAYEKASVIHNLEEADIMSSDVKVVHAGTAFNAEGNFIALGGRALGVTATGRDLEEAREIANAAVVVIDWPGGFNRMTSDDEDFSKSSLPKRAELVSSF
ncbi:hypothetical protein MLD38_027870 [Melastoma candidum]|uniref:Uncharacterized protein n=1 Tax=Melastoma candidum TaxID=119954 RepID=A0ACB9MZG5_9MYRT|nr:hypothetical protein MLD38_027870 [Melastoma candidum]